MPRCATSSASTIDELRLAGESHEQTLAGVDEVQHAVRARRERVHHETRVDPAGTHHPDQAYMVLKEKHYTVRETDVVALEVADQPGGLAGVLQTLNDHDINVEYLYAFPERESVDQAIMVFKFNNIDKAIEVLQKNNIKLMEASRVYNI